MLPIIFSVFLLSACCLNKGNCISYDELRDLKTEFAIDLYHHISGAENRTNLVVSPASVAISLELLQFGAQGNTFTELQDALGYNIHDQSVQDFLHAVHEGAANSGQGTVVQLACSFFVPTGVMLSPHFAARAAHWANSSLQQTDFTDPNRTAAQMQEWISSNLRGRVTTHRNYYTWIKCKIRITREHAFNQAAEQSWLALFLHTDLSFTLVQTGQPVSPSPSFSHADGDVHSLPLEGAASPLSRVTVVSTMYFKSVWLKKFSFMDTQILPFTMAEGSILKVPTMHHTAEVNYGQFQTATLEPFSVVELPYLGEKLSMFIVLPSHRRTPLSQVESHLSAKTITHWTSSLKRMKMDVFLPRFSIQSLFDLKTVFSALGIRDAFDPITANFKGISEQAGLYISEAIHKAKIEVTEDGTKASGATAMVLLKRSRTPIFKADRPFTFFLRQANTGMYAV
ncbi:serpin E3 [Cygnus olor]|uniref:serpin E3 n=1 Tax=Cygnus olor TaxID=8869 RepID=UPI001ADEAADE|nr:serpin E3 [Cygnus olor]